MSKHWFSIGILALSMGGCVCVFQVGNDKAWPKHEKEGKEVKVTLDQLPAAVKATVQKEADGGTIKDIDKETEDGKTTYEADATINGKPYEIKVAEDGSLISKKLDNDKDEGDKKDKHGDHHDKD